MNTKTTIGLALVGAFTIGFVVSACGDEGGPSYDTGGGYCGDGVKQDEEKCDGSDIPSYYASDCTCSSTCDELLGCNGAPITGGLDSTGDGADGADGADGGPGCDAEMIEYDCVGIAYGVYQNGTDKIMEVADGGSASSGRAVACIHPTLDEGTLPLQHHVYSELETCGVNGAYVESEMKLQCDEACEAMIENVGIFPETITASNKTWDLIGAECFFGDDIDSPDFGAGLINAISGATALGPQGCGYGSPAPDSAVANSPVEPCGGTTCASIDCSGYDPETMAGNVTSGRTIKAWVDTAFAEDLYDSMLLPFCGEGRYMWNSSTPTRAHFEALGRGELFYELGLRTNDRLLSVQEYIPGRSDPSTGTLTGPVYPLTSQMEMLTAATDLDLFASGEHFFQIKFKRGLSVYTLWVRVIDIAV